MPKKNYLLTPGPSPVPPEVLSRMAEPIIHHRTPQYQEIFKEVCEGLKFVFKTSKPVYTFTSSGTGAMESAIVNFLSPGDKVITVDAGKFGERWGKMAAAFGLDAKVIKIEYGKPVEPRQIEEALKAEPKTKAVYTTLCETSTGTAMDIKAIAAVVAKTDAILVVDAISGLGADPLDTNAWGVDIVVSGSQKGLMIPPGLAFMSVSDKAWKLVETSKLPKFYFDLKQYKKSIDKNDVPWTPAISLVIGLREALRMIKAEGSMEAVWKRYANLAEATRRAFKGIGLELFSSRPSNAITAVKSPANVDSEKIVKIMRDEFGVSIAEGQAEMKGKIFRIATMGYISEFDIAVGLSLIERVLDRLGHKFEFGGTFKAFQESFVKGELVNK